MKYDTHHIVWLWCDTSGDRRLFWRYLAMNQSRTRSLRGVAAALLALTVLAFAGCSGDAESTNAEPDEAAASAAQKRVDAYLEPVEDIDVATPLTKRPDEGKSVYYIRYNLPIAAVLDAPFKEATKALGWNGNILAIDAADPQATSNAMTRAISEGADMIAVNSGSIDGMGPGLKEAIDADVPVFLAAGVGEPHGEKNGVYGNVQAVNSTTATLGLLDLMIADSDGAGSGLLVNAPDFPILAPIKDQSEQHLADNCDGCSLDALDIAPQDLGGDIASTIVSALRQNPDIKYVIATFDGLITGLPQALAAVGLDDVKIYVDIASPPTVESIRAGDIDASLTLPDQSRTWLLVDQMARVSIGMDADQEAHANMAMQLWTTENVTDANAWDAPDFEEKFKTLWQVS